MYTDIGPLQARVMNHLWHNGAQTVAQVHTALNLDRAEAGEAALAYTTILTVMRNLARRGMVRTDATARAHVFAPTVDRDMHRAGALRDIAAQFFRGDLAEMCAFARGLT